MAKLQLILASSPRLLLERAADEFLTIRRDAADAFASPACWLAVRQGGLRDDLLSLASARGIRGWFDPPLCVFAQLPAILAGEQPRALQDYERAVLIARVLSETATRVIARAGKSGAFVEAVDRLFGELMAEGVSPESFEAAHVERTDRDEFQRQRDGDLVAAYRAYHRQLDTEKLTDPRGRWVRAAHAVRTDPHALAERLGGRRELRIVGLQDLRGGWHALLDALRTSPALDVVGLYTTVRLDEVEGLHADETVALDEGASLARSLFTGAAVADSGPKRPRVDILSAPDAEREAEHVAVRIRTLLDTGARADRIALVARNARPYADLLAASLARAGIAATMRRRTAFAEIPVVRSILALFAVAREGWSRYGLVELAQQPYLGLQLDAFILNYIGYRRRVEGLDAWADAMERLLREAVAAEKRDDADKHVERHSGNTPSSARITRASGQFREFMARARPLDDRRPLSAWLEWVETDLLGEAWGLEPRVYRVADARHDVVRLDSAGLRGIRTILGEWRSALAQWGGGEEILGVAELEKRLREMFSGDVALWSPTHRSVQILEGLAAAHREFDHVFVVGMAGGRFPLRSPPSAFYDETERAVLAHAGLPLETRQRWEQRERELFRAVVASASESLTLSWPRVDALGVETVPSAFLEELGDLAGVASQAIPTRDVTTRGISLVASPETVRLAAHGAAIEQVRETGGLSLWNGRIEAVDLLQALTTRLGESYVWSATQLESYAKCPWAFFSGRLLRLEKLEDPDIDIDPRVRGSLLHDALRRFFDAARSRTGGPVFLLPDDLESWGGDLAREALRQSIDAVDAELWLGQPVLRETKHAELQRMLEKYLRLEAANNQELLISSHYTKSRVFRTAVDAHETSFDNIAVVLGTERILLRGTIDRIETAMDDRIAASNWLAAVDYKTSKASAPGSGEKGAWADGVVLQVPLYAHVLTQLRPGAQVARVEYRAIRTGDRVHSLDLVQVAKQGRAHVLERQAENEAKLNAALDAVAGHVQRARHGVFPAQPAQSCMCPPWCHGWEICRVKGGPRAKW